MKQILSVMFLCLMPVAAFAGDGTIKRTTRKAQNEYIVTLRKELLPTAASTADSLVRQHEGRLKYLYTRAMVGFSVEMSEQQALALSRHPAVESVEENGVLQLSATTTVPTSEWYVDRIDSPSPTLSGTYTYCTTRHPTVTDTQPINIYVFDTGMWNEHDEFRYLPGHSNPLSLYRVNRGKDFVDGNYQGAIHPYTTNCPSQYNHGTTVAAAAVGLTLGNARNAYVVPIRVVGCTSAQATLDILVNAIDWVIGEAATNRTHVANFSLFQHDAPNQGVLDAVINELIDRDFVVIASANNQNSDYCASQSPARIPRVITVGATTNSPMDHRVDLAPPCLPGGACASGSNFGSCVDIFAPGFGFRSPVIPTPNDFSAPNLTQAQTSYAAGVVSGVAARFLEQNPTASPDAVWNWIRDHAVSNVVVDHRSANSGGRLVNVVPECQ